MVAHSALTGSDLHEPKGAAAASANEVLTADGSGGTAWNKITNNNIDTASIFNTNKFTLTVEKEDPSGTFSLWVPVPWTCTLTRVYAALTSAPSATLTIDVYNGSASLIDSLSWTSGASAGDRDSFNAASNNLFTAGGVVRIRNSTGIASAGALVVVLEFTQTA